MKYLKYSIFVIILFSLTLSCNRNKLKINVSNVAVDMSIQRLDQEIFELDTSSFESGINNLQNNFGEFFEIFTYKMINIGGPDNDEFHSLLRMYLTDTMITNTKACIDLEFDNFSETEKEIKKAFQHYSYYFPEKEIPKVYTCISGFNQTIVTSANIIGISLDKYLGKDFNYYQRLGIPQYKLQKMYKERIPADVMYSWGLTEFENKATKANLLSQMIYEGKLLYFVDAMLPSTHDSIKIGYTGKQLEWCKKNESQMWFNLVENKKLFATGRMDIKRLIGDGPYTNGFPLESPGKAGVWLGWQIVRKYMDANPEIKLPQLMEMQDAQKILNDSGYFPE